MSKESENNLNMKEKLARDKKALELKQSLLQEQTYRNLSEYNNKIALQDQEADAKAAPYWAEVREKANEFTKAAGAKAFDEYGTAMMDLCGALVILTKALVYSNSAERVLNFVWEGTLGQFDIVKALGQAAALKRHAAKDSDLSKLMYSVKFDDKGRLSTEVTLDGTAISAQNKEYFDVGLISWLEDECKCKLDPKTQSLTDDGAIMTFEKFNELSLDKQNGLDAYFKDKFELYTAPTHDNAPRL